MGLGLSGFRSVCFLVSLRVKRLQKHSIDMLEVVFIETQLYGCLWLRLTLKHGFRTNL